MSRIQRSSLALPTLAASVLGAGSVVGMAMAGGIIAPNPAGLATRLNGGTAAEPVATAATAPPPIEVALPDPQAASVAQDPIRRARTSGAGGRRPADDGAAHRADRSAPERARHPARHPAPCGNGADRLTLRRRPPGGRPGGPALVHGRGRADEHESSGRRPGDRSHRSAAVAAATARAARPGDHVAPRHGRGLRSRSSGSFCERPWSGYLVHTLRHACGAVRSVTSPGGRAQSLTCRGGDPVHGRRRSAM